jgi:hypothetical protein
VLVILEISKQTKRANGIMRHSKRHLWFIAAGASALIIACFLFITGRLHVHRNRNEGLPSSPSFAEHHPAHLLAGKLKQDTERVPRVTTVTPSNDDETERRGEPETTISRTRDRVLSTNPDIAAYRQLQSKVLRTIEEREQFHRMLKDVSFIDAAKRDLIETGSNFSEEDQYKRMCRVEYLDAALEWSDNPERATLLDTVEDIIFAPNIRVSQDDLMQHSIAGDKVELYLALLERDPERAKEIAAKAKGTEFERLIAYAQARHNAQTQAEKGSD